MNDNIWDVLYDEQPLMWGDEPSFLVNQVAPTLERVFAGQGSVNVLDIGCGYGRDARYLRDTAGYNVVGIDSSKAAIDIARQKSADTAGISFSLSDLFTFQRRGFDLVFMSMVYHLLRPNERGLAQRQIYEFIRPKGYLVMSVLSVNDREEYGKGDSVPGEADSFIRRVYAHFFTESELRNDFQKFEISQLYEHRYEEKHQNGETHDHTCWILVGQRPHISGQ